MKEAESLKNLRKLRSEIKGLELMIHNTPKLTVSDVVTGSSDKFPYTQHHIQIEGIETQRVSKLQLRLNRKKKKLEEELQKAELFLEEISDPEIRNILRLRYEVGLTWMEVARECGSTEKAVQKKRKDF